VTGFVAENNLDSLVKAVRRFEAHPKLIETLGVRGKNLALKEFSITKMIEAHMSLYEHLNW
jgi:hypothetical protein